MIEYGQPQLSDFWLKFWKQDINNDIYLFIFIYFLIYLKMQMGPYTVAKMIFS